VATRVHWFLPTAGDGRDVVGFGAAARRRAATPQYLGQVAQAAEDLGFAGVLTPTGTWCEDAWLTTAGLVPVTNTLQFLVAFRPGFVSPTLAAQMAATFQRQSGGRLLLNIVTGGDAEEQHRFGDWLDHDERYDRTDEFLTVLRGAWGERPFDFTGRHYMVEGATVLERPDPIPTIYFGGASDAAQRVAARHVNVYLIWGETPTAAAEQIGKVAALAAEHGRSIRFGIRLHVIARDTSNAAWAEADRLLDAMDPALITAAQERLRQSESVGQQRMAALHGGSRDALEISPNLWAGYGLVRSGAGTALVGSHDEIADRIAEYHELGFDEFILSGQPHLEEAYWFGEGVIPRLRERGLVDQFSSRSVAAPA